MKTQPDRNPPLAATLFWLSFAACSCLGTMYVAKLVGADWRLHTALGIGAGVVMLIVGGLCCISGQDD